MRLIRTRTGNCNWRYDLPSVKIAIDSDSNNDTGRSCLPERFHPAGLSVMSVHHLEGAEGCYFFCAIYTCIFTVKHEWRDLRWMTISAYCDRCLDAGIYSS